MNESQQVLTLEDEVKALLRKYGLPADYILTSCETIKTIEVVARVLNDSKFRICKEIYQKAVDHLGIQSVVGRYSDSLLNLFVHFGARIITKSDISIKQLVGLGYGLCIFDQLVFAFTTEDEAKEFADTVVRLSKVYHDAYIRDHQIRAIDELLDLLWKTTEEWRESLIDGVMTFICKVEVGEQVVGGSPNGYGD